MHKQTPIKQAAYTPAQFSTACGGRHPSFAYRLLYAGKIKAVTSLGRLLIPSTELDRVLSEAAPYNPKPRKKNGGTVTVNAAGNEG